MEGFVSENFTSSPGISSATNGTSQKSFPRHSEQETLAFVVIYTVLALFVILGNSLIIATFTRNRKLRTATNLFFVSLAVSDLFVGAFSIPGWIYILLYDLNHSAPSAFNLSFREMYTFLDISSALVSIAHLTVISIERNFSISRPLRHRVMPRVYYYIAIAVTWLYGLAIAQIFVSNSNAVPWQKYRVLLITIGGFILPLFVIICMYANIHKSVKLFNTRRRSFPSSSLQRKVIREKTIVKTVLIVTGAFAVSWLPFYTLSILFVFCQKVVPQGVSLIHLLDFVKFLHYSNSAMNPLVYTYRIQEVRTTLLKFAAPCLAQTPFTKALVLPIPLQRPPVAQVPAIARHSILRVRVGPKLRAVNSV
ncbi:adenosine receptor A1-like [Stylophora pistillata]|uniref:adenosine receptor A1-like n=1 Tax=Stylophora pistillata TaxID=50429 RepID=UPI000C054445|nr:adenosine receptor A1-like [Stylophora pistillata]XP_022808292.1 adenosine receptor A1-like [Stylophora pistillata]